MTGQQFATILARTDPFDVAQGLERHVRTLRAAQIRDLIANARSRMTESYRAEFVPLLDVPGDERLKLAFTHALKSNLRAIPLFGATFCDGVIRQIPSDRVIGLTDERRGWPALRPAALGVAAIAILLGGATVQHLFSVARATAQAPVVLSTPPPVLVPPATSAPIRVHRAIARAAVPVRASTPPPEPAPTPEPTVVEQPIAAAQPQRRTAEPVRAVHTLPAGRGVKTVVVQQTAEPSPSPQDVDVSDMPQSYSDATPLPNNQPPPQAHVSTALTVATPTPEPNRSWTHRLVHAAVHLVNSTLSTVGVSKTQPTPTPSPSGPQP